MHSEGRIKYWVIAGVVANLVMLITIGAPAVYYFGSMQAQSVSTLDAILKVSDQITQISKDNQNQEIRLQLLEGWASSNGYRQKIDSEGNAK